MKTFGLHLYDYMGLSETKTNKYKMTPLMET